MLPSLQMAAGKKLPFRAIREVQKYQMICKINSSTQKTYVYDLYFFLFSILFLKMSDVREIQDTFFCNNQ